MASVKLTNVKKIYGKNTVAVQDFNLDIADFFFFFSGRIIRHYNRLIHIICRKYCHARRSKRQCAGEEYCCQSFSHVSPLHYFPLS